MCFGGETVQTSRLCKVMYLLGTMLWILVRLSTNMNNLYLFIITLTGMEKMYLLELQQTSTTENSNS